MIMIEIRIAGRKMPRIQSVAFEVNLVMIDGVWSVIVPGVTDVVISLVKSGVVILVV